MRAKLKLLSAVLVLGLAACDAEDAAKKAKKAALRHTNLAPVPTQDVAGDILSLIPADSHAVVSVKSLDAVTKLMTDFAEAVQERPQASPAQLLAMMTGVDPSLVDATKPIVAGFKQDRNQNDPFMAFAVPVTDADKAGAGSHLQGRATQGSYLGLSSFPGYATGEGSPLLDGLPDGDLVVRVDLAAVAKLYDPEIQGLMGMGQGFATGAVAKQMPGGDAADAVAKVFDWARDLIGSAERLDMVGNLKVGILDLDIAYLAKEGSSFATAEAGTPLDGLTTYAPADFPLVLLFKLNMSTYMKWAQGAMNVLVQEMPPEARDRFNNMMEKSNELTKDLGEDWMLAANVGTSGVDMIMAGRAKDTAAYIKQYIAMLDDPALAEMGMNWKHVGEREIGGAKVQRIRLTIDGEKLAATMGEQVSPREIDMFVAILFGTGGINLDLAAVGDDGLLISISGSDKLMETALGATGAPAGLKAARGKARGDLGFLVHAELRGLLKGFAALMAKVGEKVPTIPDGGPVPVTFYGSRENRFYRFGANMDVANMSVLFKLMAEGDRKSRDVKAEDD